MRITAVLTICLLLFLSASIHLFSAIPVIDVEAIATQAYLMIEKINAWKEYFRDWLDYHLVFVERFNELKLAYTGFKNEVTSLFSIDIILINPYFGNYSHGDIWSDIYKPKQVESRLYQRYKSFADIKELVTSSALYQDGSPEIKKYFIRVLEHFKNLQKARTAMVVQVAKSKERDQYRVFRLNEMKRLLGKFSLRGEKGHTPTSDYSRLTALWANIKYDQVLYLQEILNMLTSKLDSRLKKTLISMEIEAMEQGRNLVEETFLHELLQ